MSKLNLNYKFSFLSPKPDKFGNFKIWNQPDTIEEDTITKQTIRNQKKIRNLTEVLIDDLKIPKDSYSKEDNKEANINDDIILNKNISKNVNKILNNVDKIISKIKNSQEKLNEINMNSLLSTKEKVIKSEKIEEANNSIKKKEKEYKNLNDIKKKKKAHHYKFLSEYYRTQLNKVLMNFNPIKHLGNIKTLRKENPIINEEFNEKTKIIEDELFQKTSPNFFRKNTKSFGKTFYGNNKNKIVNNKNKDNIPLKTNIDFFPNNKKLVAKNKTKNFSLPKIANFTSMGFHPIYKCYATETDIPKKIISQKKMNLFNFNQNLLLKKNKLRKFPDKEGRKLELELMEDVCKNMINSIDKVEDKNDFYNKYAKLNTDERKKMKEDYLEDKTKVENILLKLKNNNLMKGIKDETDNKRKKVTEDIKNYGKQINSIRDEILHNIEEQESMEHEYII